jgi:hypothetical protein
MHPDRIDPAATNAASRPAPHHRACTACAHGARPQSGPGAHVVGLGAPVSVRIRLAPCEIALLREQILPQRRPTPLRAIHWDATSTPALEPQSAEDQAWEQMLVELDAADDEGISVLWPTAYAAPVLHGALADALDSVAHSRHGDVDLASVADALTTAQTLLETVRAFQTVDRGGLQEVWL